MLGIYFNDNDHSSGVDPGFFLGGGALVSCSTSTPINHIVFFFCRIPLVENRRVHLRGGGCAPPRSAPALDVKILGFKTTIKKWLHNAILWSRFSGIAKGGFQGFQNPPWATAWAIISRGTRFKVLKKMRKKSIEKSIKFYFEGYIWILWGWSYMYEAPVCIQACKVGFSTLLYML